MLILFLITKVHDTVIEGGCFCVDFNISMIKVEKCEEWLRQGFPQEFWTDHWIKKKSICTYLGVIKQKSNFRHVGPPDGYKYDSINFYDGEYFMGQEQYLYTDAPSMSRDNLGR